MARARVLTLSSGSHPPDFPDRKKNGEWREEERMVKGKHEWIYKSGVAGKKRAACATPLQRLACRSKLPICCVGCCPDQLPAVIMCICVVRRYTSVHTYTRALRQAVRGSRAFERKGGYVSGGSHLADADDKARPYLPVLAKGVAYDDKTLYVPDRR